MKFVFNEGTYSGNIFSQLSFSENYVMQLFLMSPRRFSFSCPVITHSFHCFCHRWWQIIYNVVDIKNSISKFSEDSQKNYTSPSP